jgi:hypothetical protein
MPVTVSVPVTVIVTGTVTVIVIVTVIVTMTVTVTPCSLVAGEVDMTGLQLLKNEKFWLLFISLFVGAGEYLPYIDLLYMDRPS